MSANWKYPSTWAFEAAVMSQQGLTVCIESNTDAALVVESCLCVNYGLELRVIVQQLASLVRTKLLPYANAEMTTFRRCSKNSSA